MRIILGILAALAISHLAWSFVMADWFWFRDILAWKAPERLLFLDLLLCLGGMGAFVGSLWRD